MRLKVLGSLHLAPSVLVGQNRSLRTVLEGEGTAGRRDGGTG